MTGVANGAVAVPRVRTRPRPPEAPEAPVGGGAAAGADAAAGLSPKHAKFRELAAARMDKAIRSIEVVGNLSNRNNYEFTEAEIAKMVRELHKAADALEEKFKPTKRGRDKSRFSF